VIAPTRAVLTHEEQVIFWARLIRAIATYGAWHREPPTFEQLRCFYPHYYHEHLPAEGLYAVIATLVRKGFLVRITEARLAATVEGKEFAWELGDVA
jgi:hypothetical protein